MFVECTELETHWRVVEFPYFHFVLDPIGCAKVTVSVRSELVVSNWVG